MILFTLSEPRRMRLHHENNNFIPTVKIVFESFVYIFMGNN